MPHNISTPFLTWDGKNRCPSSLYPHTLLPWIFLINFLPMKIGRMLPLFSLLQTLLLPTQMIFTSVCGAQRKRRTPPLTMVSLFVTNMRIAPILSTVPPLPLRTITLRSSTVQSGNAPTLITREVNTSLTCSHSFTPTGHPFGKLKVSRSRHSLIPCNTPTMMSPPPPAWDCGMALSTTLTCYEHLSPPALHFLYACHLD